MKSFVQMEDIINKNYKQPLQWNICIVIGYKNNDYNHALVIQCKWATAFSSFFFNLTVLSF